MFDRSISERPTLVVLASTYPRWQGDHEPGFVHELAKRLTDQFQVIAVVPRAPGAVEREVLDGVEVIRYRYAPRRFETLVNDGGIVTNLRRYRWKWLLVPTFVLAQAWRTWSLSRDRQVDVIHAHWLFPQGLVIALLGKLSRRSPSYLVTSHGADLFALRGRGMSALKRLVIRNAAAVTVVSEVMRDELARIGADVGKVSVQPMGVDLTGRFMPDPEVRRSDNEILFVGRLVEKKGLRHLIDAMPYILEQRADVTLIVAGFGPEEAERRAQTERLGITDRVNFLGGVPQVDLPALYRRAAAFVAPFVQAESGDQEGLGLVLVEALGCGCPVITTRLPPVREVFGGDWPEYWAEPSSPQSLAVQVLRVLAEPDAAALRVAAQLPKLRARFDQTSIAGAYASSLLRCCTTRGNQPLRG